MIRKILGLALLGFLVVTFSGPVFTILALALVGFVAWSLLRAALSGDHMSWEKARIRFWRLGKGIFRLLGFIAVVAVEELFYLGSTLGRKGAWLSRAAWEKARTEAPIVGGFVVEVISGAAIGGLIGLAIGYRQEFLPAALSIGIGTGAGFGILVGIFNWRSARRSIRAA